MKILGNFFENEYWSLEYHFMCNIVIDAYDYSSIEVVFTLYILMRMDLSIIALGHCDTNIYNMQSWK